MSQRELLAVWSIGLALCGEEIAMFKIIGSDLYAFIFSLAVVSSLFLLKDKEGRDVCWLIRRYVKA